MALSFFNLGAWGALYAVTPEMYPTSLRATGSGWAAGVGRIASIGAPLTVPVAAGARRGACALRGLRGVLPGGRAVPHGGWSTSEGSHWMTADPP